MDALSHSQTEPTRHLHSRSRSRVKSILSREPPSTNLKKRDYVIGICLLLIVVFLWTSSNFITQVSKLLYYKGIKLTIYQRIYSREGLRSHFCTSAVVNPIVQNTEVFDNYRVTYLNTSSFALYLVPFSLRGVWSRWRGLKVDEPRRGRCVRFHVL